MLLLLCKFQSFNFVDYLALTTVFCNARRCRIASTSNGMSIITKISMMELSQMANNKSKGIAPQSQTSQSGFTSQDLQANDRSKCARVENMSAPIFN